MENGASNGIHHVWLVFVTANQDFLKKIIMSMHTSNYIMMIGSWKKMMVIGLNSNVDEENKNSSLNQSFHLS